MKRFVLSIIFTALFYSISNAQQPLNFDFEKLSVEGIKRPWGWDNYAWKAEVVLDSVTKHHGKYSLRLSANAGDTTQENELTYDIEPFLLQGKPLSFRGYIKVENVTGQAYTTITYAIDSAGQNISKTKFAPYKISGTTGWHLFPVVVSIPANATMVTVSIGLKGSGAVWFDDFMLNVNGIDKTVVETSTPFTPVQMDWLKKSGTVLTSVNPTPQGKAENFDDLKPFGDIAQDATVIGLGEATHGTREFFTMKNRLLEYAVKKLGVRIFAIEDNMLIVERVNKYVKDGKGTARNSMYGMFTVWQNKEVHDMIQWVRDNNVAHPNDMVEFMGFDVQNIDQPLDSLSSFLMKHDKPLADTAAYRLKALKEGWANSWSADSVTKYNWYSNAEFVWKSVAAQKDAWLATAKNKQDSTAIDWGMQYANLVKQYAQNTWLGHMSFYRDVAMADNISWILSQHKPGSKIVVWAHDYHIGRGDHPDNNYNTYFGISMGSHLSKKYGDNYKAFSQASYTGTYSAQPNYSNFTYMPCPLFASPVGSLDEALHRIAQERKSIALLLNLQGARKVDWLAAPLPTRFANHVNIDYAYWPRLSVPFQFDAIIFIDKTNAAKTYE